MSPTANEVEKKILKRPLKNHDVLVGLRTGQLYEVVDATAKPYPDATLEMPNTSESIRYRLLTSIGPVVSTYSVPKDFDTWQDVVPRTQRTDINFLRRLGYRISDRKTK